GLLAALLASAVALSAYGVFQYWVEIPENARLSRTELQAQMEAQGISRGPDDPYWHQLELRARSPNIFGTFGHPNSFAGFLGLLLPVAIGAVVARRRASGWSRPTIYLACGAALIALALWWTHSRGAVAAVLIVGAVAAAWI